MIGARLAARSSPYSFYDWLTDPMIVCMILLWLMLTLVLIAFHTRKIKQYHLSWATFLILIMLGMTLLAAMLDRGRHKFFAEPPPAPVSNQNVNVSK